MTQAVPTLIANGLEIQYVTLVDASGNAIATAASLGQKVMAASSPVVIAIDQSAIPVTLPSTQNVNLEGTAFASAARTTQQLGADIDNPYCRGISITFDITAASGAGGLQIAIQSKDPASAKYTTMMALATAITTTGTRVYQFFPGSVETAGNITQRGNLSLPRTFRIAVLVGDSSSYTYSVGYSLLR
jgi:hypothetical protein